MAQHDADQLARWYKKGVRVLGLWLPGLALALAPVPALSEAATSALVSSRSLLGGSWLFRVDLVAGTTAPVELEERDEGGGTRKRGRHVVDAAWVAHSQALAIDEDISTDVIDPDREFAPPAIVRIDLESRLVTELVRIEPEAVDPLPGFGSPVRLAGLAIESDSSVLVLHHDRSAPQPATSLLRVDLVSGEATSIASGGELCLPSNLVFETPETVVLACGVDESASVVRVRLRNGEQEIAASGGLLVEPTEMALDSGGLLVGDLGLFSLVDGSYRGRIVRIGPEGESILATGEFLSAPWTLDRDGEGKLIVGNGLAVDTQFGVQPVASLVGIDTFGEQTLLFEDNFQVGSVIETVLLLPEPATSTMQLSVLAALLLLRRRASRACGRQLPSSGFQVHTRLGGRITTRADLRT